MNPQDVSNCQRCNSSLERGYNYKYVGDDVVEVICFKCSEDEEFENYLKSNKLTINLIMNNSSRIFYILESSRDPKRLNIQNKKELETLKRRLDIQIASLEIQNKIKEFESKVWFNGLQQTIRASTVKGVTAKTKEDGNFCVLTYSMAGRTMITIEDDACSVSMVADETSETPTMGLQGVRSNLGYALYLISLAIKKWEAKMLFFSPDSKVGMF